MAVPSVYPLLSNARIYQGGIIGPRPGLGTPLFSIGGAIAHSLARLNDSLPGAARTFLRIAGIGTTLCLPDIDLLVHDTGYSGNPLALVTFRPEQSPQAWLYIADSVKNRKVRSDGTIYNRGIAPPLAAPTVALGAPLYALISDFEAVGAWTNGGTAGAITAPARVTTTISAILYDSGTTGWACCAPVAITNIQPGATLTINTGGATAELVTAQSVKLAIPTGITIGSIKYDSGATGPCSIQPSPNTTPLAGMVRNAMLRLNSGGGNDEYVRVLSITRGPGGLWSFRCSTVNNHAATEMITGVRSFRAYFVSNHAPAEHIDGGMFQSTIATGTGYLSLNAAYDLSKVGSRASQPTDKMHLSIRMDAPQNVTEGQILINVDPTDTTFTQNYYIKTFRASDLTPVVQQTLPTVQAVQVSNQLNAIIAAARAQNAPAGATAVLTARQEMLQQTLSNPPSSPTADIVSGADQSAAGVSQWTELVFNLQDLTRIGTDKSRSLANVTGVRIALITTGAVVLNVDAWWVGGSYGPDVGDIGMAYAYVTRGRSSVTGAKSNPSPPLRTGIEPHSQRVVVTGAVHPDAQVDTVDFFRFGGTLSQWFFINSAPNAGTPQVSDDLADADLAGAEILEVDNSVPYTTLDIPRSGTCNVAGTTITRVSGDNFNTSWAPGSQIIINGVAFTLYAQPSSVSQLEIVENGGTQTGVSFLLPGADLLGQSLPTLWGPFALDSGSFFFSCGDLYQPGTLFVTKGNNADSGKYTIEITSPSDPLMNGCMFGDGFAYVYSTKRKFRLIPSFGEMNPFVPIEVQGSHGLFSRWGLAVGPRQWTLAEDGIYESGGGAETSITLKDLALLFPHEGQAGQAITFGSTTFYPPDMTQTSRLRLSYYDDILYFDYVDTQGNSRSLTYHTELHVWSADTYTPGTVTHYGEEGAGVHSLLAGGTDGNIYQMSGVNDGASPFPMAIRMPQMSELLGGFMHFRDGFLGVSATADLSLVENVDGVDFSLTVPNNGGSYTRPYIALRAAKGRLFAWALTSTKGFQLFLRDCEFRCKPWAGAEYGPVNPFANLARAQTGRAL